MNSIVDKNRFSGMIDGVIAFSHKERHHRSAKEFQKEQSVSEVSSASNGLGVVYGCPTEPTGYGLFLRTCIVRWKGVSVMWNPFKKTKSSPIETSEVETEEKSTRPRKQAKQKKPVRYVLNRKERRVLRTNLHRMSPFCSYCGVMIGIEETTLDHILPTSKGGDDRPSNLCICCSECNNAKADKTITEWQGRPDSIQGANLHYLLDNLKEVSKKLDAIFADVGNLTLIPFDRHLIDEKKQRYLKSVPLTHIEDHEFSEPQTELAISIQEPGESTNGNN